MRSFWIIRAYPKSNNKCPYKRCTVKRRHRLKENIWQQRKKWKFCSHGPRSPWSHQNLHRARNDAPLESQKRASQQLDFTVWPLQLWENKLLLFRATQNVVISYGSPRKWIHISTSYRQSVNKSCLQWDYIYASPSSGCYSQTDSCLQ